MSRLVHEAKQQKRRRAIEDTPESSNTEGADDFQNVHLTKKPRTILADAAAILANSPITPGPRGRRAKVKGATHRLHGSPLSINNDGADILDRPEQSSSRNAFSSTPSYHHTQSTIAAPPSPPSFTEGMVATPPVADEDMEPLQPFGEAAISSSKATDSFHETSTASLQEPILPSPVASPISSPHQPAEHTEDLDVDQDLLQLNQEQQMINRSEPSSADLDEQIPMPILQLHLTGVMNYFENISDKAQEYLIYHLLRRCDTPRLRFISGLVNPALKCDFLTRLPPELSLQVIRYLDTKTLCRASQVSKRWRELIDSDDKVWRELLQSDGYHVPNSEFTRAIREGWQYQGLTSYEKDLSREIRASGFHPNSHNANVSSLSITTTSSESHIRHGKRKHTSKPEHSHKRRRVHDANESHLSSKLEIHRVVESLRAPVLTDVPPELGLKHLRIPHLYKTIYRRHHCIRNSWTQPNSRPQHLAFRAHGRHVVTCLQFDDDKVLTGSDDTRIHVYNSSNGALRTVLDGHDGGVWALQYDGNTLVSGSTDRTVRVWDIEKGRCLHVFHGHTSTVRCLVILKPTVIGYDGDRPIIMPRQPLIITGSRDTSLRIWQLPGPGDPPFNPTGELINEELNPYFVRALSGHVSSVRAIAAHGDTLVSGSYDSTVRVWKISTGEVLHRLNGHTSKVYSVILDHERKRCISGSMDTMVKVWSLETGDCLLNLEGHTSLVGLLDLSHGRLVSAAADSSLRIWDPETGHCKSTLLAHTGAITCFQHDHQKVISGSDRALKLWNVQTGEIVKDLLLDLSGGWQVKFNDRKCVAAVQRRGRTYIEVIDVCLADGRFTDLIQILDFGASRDGVSEDQLGDRIVVDENGQEVEDYSDDDTVDD